MPPVSSALPVYAEGDKEEHEEREEKPYRVGDTVWLEKNQQFRIESIAPDNIELKLVDNRVGPRIMTAYASIGTEEFERQLQENLFNGEILARSRQNSRTPEKTKITAPVPEIPGAAEHGEISPPALGTRVKSSDPLQLSLFSTEEERGENRRGTENERDAAGSRITDSTKRPLDGSDINFALISGVPLTGAKERIANLYRQLLSSKNRANAIKKEYGTGGWNLVYPDGVGGWAWHDAKELRLTKGRDEAVSLSWADVHDRVGSLIESGRYGVEPFPVSLMGKEGQEREKAEPVPAFYQAEESPITQTQKDPENPGEQEREKAPEQPKVNYRITDDALGVGGQKTKYKNNIEAIRTLKKIEDEERRATPEEQEALSRYVGWGGIPQAFDEEHENWRREYEELKELLSEKEYTSARASTLNAHYTSPLVIRAIYETVERMGFRKGNILEPAMGVGNFFGMLPESMKESKLYGVELDDLTGRMAKQLYQQADITVSGFERTRFPDSFFDVAVGNVPFGSYKLADSKYDKHNFLIHDYFFAKTLDQVRPGGIVAFISSKGTMDKANPAVRKYLAQRADLLGAVRLPNTAFKANAGTEVTTDIIFLQKRDRMIDIEPDWVHSGFLTTDGAEKIPVNSYFAENPHMILGKMVREKTLYGNEDETACIPFEGADLSRQLAGALEHIHGALSEREIGDEEESAITDALPADPSVRNYSHTLIDGEIYYRENSLMLKVRLSPSEKARVRGLIELRECARSLIDLQLNDGTDAEIKEKQEELNRLYDAFTPKYGLINSRTNARVFDDESSYYLLCSLEILDEDGNLERKADMFSKRTIRGRTLATSAETPEEALVLSLAEKARVDLEYMSGLLKMTPENIIRDLKGVIFPNPEVPEAEGEPRYETADEYLSGNVRHKLDAAREWALTNPERYDVNIAALEAVQPKELAASEIQFRLGATWIDPEDVGEFMYELLQTPEDYREDDIRVSYSPRTARWGISGKRMDRNNIRADRTWGTGRINAYQVIEETLNLRDIRIYDTKTDEAGNETRVLNKKETTLAQQKQEAIKAAFQSWLFKDPERRERLVEKYNILFNSTRPREYDGRHISLPGINPEIGLREHQLNAIAHILYGGNTLLAHEVGAGKTFEMVAAAMESKRLGLSRKSLFAVPNHLTEQTASEFMRLYPAANILVATKKDFETKNRKKFCARIATGDYDAIIIGHSQFEKIPMSPEREERLLQEQIDEIAQGIEEMKTENAERFSIKQFEAAKRNLESKLRKLNSVDRKDDVVNFEQLGVDRIFVDEAHMFKNLYLVTKMRNVAGIPQTEAQKSSDLLMKCRYLDEMTGGKGVVFATGTPVSNSMTELYTMMRYLQHDMLKEQHMEHFDSWASSFGEVTTAIELAPEGTGYRAKSRFARFFNVPELMTRFRESADIKTADMLDLPTPEPSLHVVAAKPSEYQKKLVESLSERARAVHNREVEPYEDNMLKITSDGRKIGLDQRLINPLLPDDPGSKVNACAENIYEIWEKSKEKRLTQMMFCDFSTPAKDKFDVYNDIRGKLLTKGIPENEIAFIHDADSEMKKKELFSRVRKGQVRVLMGSTAKMGAGTNVQDRLFAIHDLDCPWRPADLEQRRGRMVRQGNTNPEVHIYRYVTEATFDAYLYQTIENKQKFISQIMTSKNPARSCEDVDESVLSYAEIKALCTGNPLIKEKMNLDMEVGKLRFLKSEHQNSHYQMEDELLKFLPRNIAGTEQRIERHRRDLKETVPLVDHFAPMTLLGKAYTSKEDNEEAGKAIIAACKSLHGVIQAEEIGTYRGFSMILAFNPAKKNFEITLKNNGSYRVELGESVTGNFTRINNVLDSIPERLATLETDLEKYHRRAEDIKAELQKPFEKEEELQRRAERLSELDALLNMDVSAEEQETPNQGDPENPMPETSAPAEETREEQEAIEPEETPETGENPLPSDTGVVTKNTYTAEFLTIPPYMRDVDPWNDTHIGDRYRKCPSPKAAKFLNIHGERNPELMQNPSPEDMREYVRGILETSYKTHGLAGRALNQFNPSLEAEFIIGNALDKVSDVLDLPRTTPPETIKNFMPEEIAEVRERASKFADALLWGHLPHEVYQERVSEYQRRSVSIQAQEPPAEERSEEIRTEMSAIWEKSLQEAKEILGEKAGEAQINIVRAEEAPENKPYRGEILEITQHHVIQLRNRDTAYIHDLAAVDGVPEKGEKLSIEYRNGRGKVVSIQEAEQDRNVGMMR